MRVIAKKRCRAMFQPPEKGERATLNPNLSTRLNFSDQAFGRRVGYCWSRRASVPRVVLRVYTHKTPNVRSGGPADLKISHSITADPYRSSATTRSISRACIVAYYSFP